MKEGPDIALIGSLIGDPARANMLTTLMSGKALTASELAAEAGITAQTASSHLSKLEGAGLLTQRKQGRHRYFAIADDEVGNLLEAMMGLAAKRGHMRARTGPRDPALRKARVCYNHLAGEFGVRMFDSLAARGLVVEEGEEVSLTDEGEAFVSGLGIDLPALTSLRRPLCKSCLDWSMRRTHLAGALGTALLDRFYDLGWARRVEGTRIVSFTGDGERRFLEMFPAA
ncbi:helix-turn-helix domain-containing protein [Nisaea acidiphila]|uniref:Helix-turn-helix domain-containing protein n=1 Tax=Nisaea acidiphila TaxID=1862145 RepID=A0A9J7AQL1_9PROT|nr:helix-turn-helix domain-containing protein [Nisaea acidiphila]UUX49891.1 helix-turn-helix domain-containing protein [Nisaea acidiphila]